MLRFSLWFAACGLSVALCTGAIAQDKPDPVPVATLVTVKTPPGISRSLLEEEFKRASPIYEKIPGLIRKYFILNANSFGGMYLWKDRASAEAWYSAAWRAKAKANYNSEPELSWFEVPVQVDNSGIR